MKDHYQISVQEIEFLPIGADRNTAVYRIVADNGSVYFLKLRSGGFLQASVEVPKFFSDRGIGQIIPPLMNGSDKLFTTLPPFKAILYPFIEGQNGFEQDLTELQWVEFGVALKKVHTTKFPAGITSGIAHEDFSPYYRNATRDFLEFVTANDFTEPVALEMARFIKTKGNLISDLVNRAEIYAHVLNFQTLEKILCHGDIHGWNLLIHDENTFYMVDWDTLIFAPKERDLMFIGGGLGGYGYSPKEEEDLFYKGYGLTEINPYAMAYYRYERIIEDIAVFCEQVFLSNEGEEDKRQALKYMKSSFLPGQILDIAISSDKTGYKFQA